MFQGPNLTLSCRDLTCEVRGDVEIETETFRAYTLGTVRKTEVGV